MAGLSLLPPVLSPPWALPANIPHVSLSLLITLSLLSLSLHLDNTSSLPYVYTFFFRFLVTSRFFLSSSTFLFQCSSSVSAGILTPSPLPCLLPSPFTHTHPLGAVSLSSKQHSHSLTGRTPYHPPLSFFGSTRFQLCTFHRLEWGLGPWGIKLCKTNVSSEGLASEGIRYEVLVRDGLIPFTFLGCTHSLLTSHTLTVFTFPPSPATLTVVFCDAVLSLSVYSLSLDTRLSYLTSPHTLPFPYLSALPPRPHPQTMHLAGWTFSSVESESL